MNPKLAAAILLALPFIIVAGCGETKEVIVYKPGKYQGKPDTRPWDGQQFKGDKAEWERTVNQRAVGQNEYVRIKGG
ncbi:MAG: formate dehydrogenase [Betaproteobacteria bacterium SG8_41]|jgi:hypothetical protein|nr:MAG: formate dehydrogenase [Betaproteobacteria bacterium SG8_41]